MTKSGVGVTFNVTISSFSFSDSHDAKLNAAERPRVRKKIFLSFILVSFMYFKWYF